MDRNETRSQMSAILKEFTASLAADPEMAAFARGKNVVFTFNIQESDQTFFMSFLDGKVGAGLENPPRMPDFKLTLAADILDGIFSGGVNAIDATTSGQLSFSGDTGKALDFIRIQDKLSRLYTEARARVALTPTPLPLRARVSMGEGLMRLAAQASALPSPLGEGLGVRSPAILKTGDIRDQILQVNNEMFAKGLITATGGNVSARCDDNPNEIWITPSAIFKGDLRADMMVRIDLDGRVVSPGQYPASSERRVHCALYKLRPDVTAVIHTHALQTTLMALTGTRFLPISTDSAFLGDIPVVPFIMPGTDELGDKVAEAIGPTGIAAIMQNHGLVVAGTSLRRGADMTDIIELTAQKILTCKMLDIKPVLLPEQVVRELMELGASMA